MKTLIKIVVLILIISSQNIFPLEITDLKPIGGEVYQNSTSYTLIWDVDDTTSSINLMLWDGNLSQWDTIATNIPGTTTSYDWVPNQSPGSLFRLKAVDNSDSDNYVMSLSYFTIVDPPQQYTAVKEKVRTQLFILYPNPTDNNITIEINEEPINEIFLWDSKGVMLMRKNRLKLFNYTLSLNNYPDGLYYIEVILNSGMRLTSKIVLLK